MTATTDRLIGSIDGLNPAQAAQVGAYLDLLDADSRPVPDVYRWTNALPGVALTIAPMVVAASVGIPGTKRATLAGTRASTAS